MYIHISYQNVRKTLENTYMYKSVHKTCKRFVFPPKEEMFFMGIPVEWGCERVAVWVTLPINNNNFFFTYHHTHHTFEMNLVFYICKFDDCKLEIMSSLFMNVDLTFLIETSMRIHLLSDITWNPYFCLFIHIIYLHKFYLKYMYI